MAFTRVEAEMFKVSSVLHEPLYCFLSSLKSLSSTFCSYVFSNFSFKRKNILFWFCFLVPPGVIQNGARVLSRGIFPGARPLPINPIGSMAVAVR